MGLFTTIGDDFASLFGAGANPNLSWGEQNADFIKLQFKYALDLKNKLADGTITQDYYNNNFWLTTQTLTPPSSAWFDEFKTAVESEDLNWLSAQVGQSVEELTAYLGSSLRAVASAAGNIVGTAISSTTGGLATGFLKSLNGWGYLALAGIGVAIYFGFKKGYIQRALKIAALLVVFWFNVGCNSLVGNSPQEREQRQYEKQLI